MEDLEDVRGLVGEGDSDSHAIEPMVQEPLVSVQRKLEPPVRAKREQVLHTLYDAKIEKIEEVKQIAGNMDLDKWSRIVARLDRERDVKVDANITAMGIFAMFPVAVEGEME